MRGSTGPTADYLGGDPFDARSISDGRLEFDSSGLRFSGPGGDDLRLPVEGLLGISISGRAAERRRRRARRGTMRIAGLRGVEPAEWVFAIDRSEATALRSEVNRELAARGRPPLPFVEELDGFPLGSAPSSAEEADAEPRATLSIAELGHRLDGADGPKRSRRWHRILPWALLTAALVAAVRIMPLV